MESKVINMFGNPGSGKSTMMAYIFSELKRRGFEVEMAPEIAKEHVWDEDFRRLRNQVLVFAEQLHRIERLNGKVQYIITDSPLIIKIGYYKERKLPEFESFKKLCKAFSDQYNNVNILLESNQNVSEVGRDTLDLDPMKHIKDMDITFDLVCNCKDREKVLEYILNLN